MKEKSNNKIYIGLSILILFIIISIINELLLLVGININERQLSQAQINEFEKAIRIEQSMIYGKEIGNSYSFSYYKYIPGSSGFMVSSPPKWNVNFVSSINNNVISRNLPIAKGFINCENLLYNWDPYKSLASANLGYHFSNYSLGYEFYRTINYLKKNNVVTGGNNSIKKTKYADVNILDKVAFGKIGKVDLLWTVCKKEDGKILLCSDYGLILDYALLSQYEGMKAFYNSLGMYNFYTKKENESIVRQENDNGRGYYYFVLPTDIYQNTLTTKESKEIIGSFRCDGISDDCYSLGGSYTVGGYRKAAEIVHRPYDNSNDYAVRLCMYVDSDYYNIIEDYDNYPKFDFLMMRIRPSYYAGYFVETNSGIKFYNNSDECYYDDGWQFIDDNNDGIYEYYYFSIFGNVLRDATTPDGLKVNDKGQLVIDDIVLQCNLRDAVTSKFLHTYDFAGAYEEAAEIDCDRVFHDWFITSSDSINNVVLKEGSKKQVILDEINMSITKCNDKENELVDFIRKRYGRKSCQPLEEIVNLKKDVYIKKFKEEFSYILE